MPAQIAAKRKPARRPVHVPQRTCVICRQRNAKRQLTRVVRQTDGVVAVDPTGKMNGRGAYICDAPACWGSASDGRGLARALKTELSPDDLERLRNAATAHLAPVHSE